MKLLRAALFVVALVLVLVDIRVADLLLNGYDVVQVGMDGQGWQFYNWRFSWADCVFFIVLVAIHAVVALGLIRTRHATTPTLKTS